MPHPVLSRNPLGQNAHFIESKPFCFCRSKQWLFIVFLSKRLDWAEVILSLSPNENFS